MDFSASSTLAQGIRKCQEKEKPDDLVKVEENPKPKFKNGHGHTLIRKSHARNHSNALV